LFSVLRKEMKKYCYYSLFSRIIKKQDIKRINFFVLVLKDGNKKLEKNLYSEFDNIVSPVNTCKENNLIILDYYTKGGQLFIEKKLLFAK